MIDAETTCTQIEWVSMWDMAPPDAVERYRVEEFDIAPSRDKSTRDYWILHRTLNTTWGQLLSGVQGANLFKPVLEGRLRHLAFDEDGVSCEWVYWVDFANRRFVMEYGPKGKDPVWTFDEMREEGSFWAVMVDNKRRRDRRDQEFDARFKVDKSVRWKPDRYKYPDPWKCRDSPRSTKDEEAGGDVNDDNISGDGDSGDEDEDEE